MTGNQWQRYFKWAIPGLFFIYFRLFSSKHYNFYNKYMWNNVHPVYGARIRTHDLQYMSLLPQPLDQRSRSSVTMLKPLPGNTHLLHEGNYHCTANLLLYLFIFSCFAHVTLITCLLVWLNPSQSNRRSAIQWYFPWQSKCSQPLPTWLVLTL